MDKGLLELAAESVFCGESVDTRFAESIRGSTKVAVALATFVSIPFTVIWWLAPNKTRGGLPKSLGLVLPVAMGSAAYLGAEGSRDNKSESFEAAYRMKCNYCVDDERCQSLYGSDWECVEGECMEMVEDEEDAS